jgi:AraC-like DNA-binding protein
MIQEAEILDQLSHSKVCQDFERSFCETTELPVRLRSLRNWDSVCNGERYEQDLLKVIAVPVRLGDNIIGVLQTGRAALENPTVEHFENWEKRAQVAGVKDLNRTKYAYFHSLVLSRSRYDAMVRLLEIFAEQLSFLANQIVIQQNESEPYRVRRARAFISIHLAENINLSDVAKETHVSTFYLCKIFKKATGLTFVEFRNRLRIESAKKLLLNQNLRVSEIAYAVGFQSLTQFNRLFRRVVGRSPTGFRGGLAKAVAVRS